MLRRLGGLFVLAVTAMGCTSGVALASGSNSARGAAQHAAAASSVKGEVPIQGGAGSCGALEPGDPVLGTVKLSLNGKTGILKIKTKMTAGIASESYGVYLFGPECSYLGQVGEFLTNVKGHGKNKAEVSVGGEAEVFLDVAPTVDGPFGPLGTSNDTPYIAL